MPKQKTLVYLPSIPFNFLTQLPQQLLMRFARNGWKVYYLNIQKRNDVYLEEVESNLFVVHDIDRFIKENKNNIFDVRLVSIPQYVNMFPEINGKIKIFYLLDHFEHWKVGEKQAFENSDMVLTVSDYLYEKRKNEYNHPHFYVVKNGVPEYYLEKYFEEPEEFKTLKRPIIGFIGSTGGWTDTSLLRKVAEKYTTIFIGKELDKKCPENVINLGYIDNNNLGNYYANIDVGLLPFRTTGIHAEVTKSSCPIKTFEYMGVGVPCVATKWGETEIYPNIVFDSKDEKEFMINIEKVININKIDYKIKSQQEARKHTWELRYKQIENIINIYCKNNNIRI